MVSKEDMTKVKKQLKAVRRQLLEALIDLFSVGIAYEEKKYFYIKDIHRTDPLMLIEIFLRVKIL